jgi:hypothetical protein
MDSRVFFDHPQARTGSYMHLIHSTMNRYDPHKNRVVSRLQRN